MPAETHRHGEPVGPTELLQLIWELVGTDDAQDRFAEVALAAIGLDDELALLDLWDAIAEEVAERTVAEPDIDSLRSARTVGELAQVVADSLPRVR
jgi:hypothetical protein